MLLQMMNHHCLTLIFLLTILSSSSRITNAAVDRRQASMIQQFLGLQNAARSSLKLPPLVWDPKIAKYAAWYANKRRRDCALVHSNGPLGENIFWGSGGKWSPVQAAAAWVSEKRVYNYRTNSCAYRRECGHYTQIVWRGTRRVGCAKVVCASGRGVFMTCNYYPPGNYVGERPY